MPTIDDLKLEDREGITRMTPHTQEPWTATDVPFGTAVAAGEQVVAQMCADASAGKLAARNALRQANARRIVACVNACAGIPTDTLEKGFATKRDGESVHLNLTDAIARIQAHAVMHSDCGLRLARTALREVGDMLAKLRGEGA